MRRALLLVILVFGATIAFGQPRIDNVQTLAEKGYPLSNILITGEGFSNTKADLEVWFGSVKGDIVSSTLTSIVVTIPASARVSFVEVIHKVNLESARYHLKFTPTFSGDPAAFNISNFQRSEYTNADQIWDICSCDFDKDGDPDIIGSKQEAIGLMFLRNNSTAALNVAGSTLSFSSSEIAHATKTYSLACGDLNGDAKPELIVTNSATNLVYIYINRYPTLAGIFDPNLANNVTLVLPDFQKGREVAINDMNLDGRPEIMVTTEQSGFVYIFENKIDKKDGPAPGVITASKFTRIDKLVDGVTGTQAIETGDMNGDGWPDILVAANNNGTTALVMKNPANGTLIFGAPSGVSGATDIKDIAVADFNNDGKLDYVVADRGEKAIVYLNIPPTLGSIDPNFSKLVLTAPKAFGVDVADMDGDGDIDIVVTNRRIATDSPPIPMVSVFINNGSGTAFATHTFNTGKSVVNVKAMDFDGDSKPDIACTTLKLVVGDTYSIDVWKNTNCHVPTFITKSPLTLCNPQDTTIVAVGLKGIAYSMTGFTGNTVGSTRLNVTTADAGGGGQIALKATGVGSCATLSDAIFQVFDGAGTQPKRPNIKGSDVCAGNPLDVSTDSIADAYEWSGPKNFISTLKDPPAIANATTENAGFYKLRVKKGNCYSEYTEEEILVKPAATFQINTGTLSVCVGETLELSAYSTTGGSVSGYSFQWKLEGGNVTGDGVPLSDKYLVTSVTEADQGNYSFFASRTDPNCSNTSTAVAVKVYSKPVPAIEGIPALVCVGTAIPFDGSSTTGDTDSSTPAITYAWDFDDTNTTTGETPAPHTYASAGDYDAKLTVSYAGLTDCAVELTESVTVQPATAPTITVDPAVTEICGDGTETVVLYVNGTFSSYAWTPTAPNLDSLVATGPGTYAVVTTAANGCTGNAQFTLTPKPGCETATAGIPKVFTPNGDTFNDLWIISGVPQIDECSMSIFDGRGRRILEVKGFPVTGWDGVANGKAVPDGTYYYVLGCPGSKPKTGSVLIVR